MVIDGPIIFGIICCLFYGMIFASFREQVFTVMTKSYDNAYHIPFPEGLVWIWWVPLFLTVFHPQNGIKPIFNPVSDFVYERLIAMGAAFAIGALLVVCFRLTKRG